MHVIAFSVDTTVLIVMHTLFESCLLQYVVAHIVRDCQLIYRTEARSGAQRVEGSVGS